MMMVRYPYNSKKKKKKRRREEQFPNTYTQHIDPFISLYTDDYVKHLEKHV